MAPITVTAAATVPAPNDRVYALLRDYRGGHPSILPPKYFRDLVVESGGQGDGTVIRFRVVAGGSSRTIRARITEPDPGRHLAEEDLDTGAVTSFHLVPAAGGAATRVTITTSWTPRGFAGWIERWFAPPLLRKIYGEELALLAAAVAPARTG